MSRHEQPTTTWSGRVLWPLLLLQTIVYIIGTVYLAVALSVLVGSKRSQYGASSSEAGVAIAGVAYFSVALLTVFGEIIAYALHSLNLWAFFGLQIFKSLFWTFILVVTAGGLASAEKQNEVYRVGVGIVIWLIITSIAVYCTLAYSCVQVHRRRMAKAALRAERKHVMV